MRFVQSRSNRCRHIATSTFFIVAGHRRRFHRSDDREKSCPAPAIARECLPRGKTMLSVRLCVGIVFVGELLQGVSFTSDHQDFIIVQPRYIGYNLFSFRFSNR